MNAQALTNDAAYELVRGVADRGEDYGWDVYRNGTTISAASRRTMIKSDDQAAAWLAAFDFALAQYSAVSKTGWRY